MLPSAADTLAALAATHTCGNLPALQRRRTGAHGVAARTPPHFLARIAAALSLAALFGAVELRGQDVDYDPGRAPELRPCDDHRYHGRAPQARSCYEGLLRSSNSPLVRAEAAWGIGDVKTANEYFREATQADEQAIRPRVRWGRLYLFTHQYVDASELFSEALKIDSDDVQARLGMTQLFVDQFSGNARKLVEEVLKDDDKLIAGHLLAAQIDLDGGRYKDAEKSLDEAVELIEKQKLPPLEAYELLAALELLRGNASGGRWAERALAYNPRYGGVFEMLAHYEIMRRKYAEANVWLRRAVEVQPDLWSAHAELGANLLRLGEVEASRQHLERAYSGDPYSATTVNTLRLLDTLRDFSVDRTESPAIVTRLHKKEADALRPYVVDVTRQSIEAFSKRYGFQPKQAITVELYSDHDDFAVRTAGLPGIGLLGVTFGYLVAMDSPSGRATGEFHWGSTLWHEMAHVFTLSVTDHRVPRWLSEGISVFEEWRTGPTPGVIVSPRALDVFGEGDFLPVATLDEGFIRPAYDDQVQVSYIQSGLICLFIEQKWGFERLVALLKQFTRDTTTAAAIEATFRMAPAKFDEEFNAFVKQRFAGMLANSDEWQKQMRAAHTAANAEKWDEVLTAARRAVEIFPEFTTSGSPYLLIAQALDKTSKRNEAIETLQRYRQFGGWDPDALRQLAQWLEEAKREPQALEILNALLLVDPLDASLHAKLGERLYAGNKATDSLREYRVLLALGAHDSAAANFGIARALNSMGDRAASRRHLLDALETAPHYRPAQDLLLEMTGKTP
jgi:tetratricopeptide (TPR) repeat protein